MSVFRARRLCAYLRDVCAICRVASAKKGRRTASRSFHRGTNNLTHHADVMGTHMGLKMDLKPCVSGILLVTALEWAGEWFMGEVNG